MPVRRNCWSSLRDFLPPTARSVCNWWQTGMLGSRVPGIQQGLFSHVWSSCTSSQVQTIFRLGCTTAGIRREMKWWYQWQRWPSFQSVQRCGNLPGLSSHPGPLDTCVGTGSSLFHTTHRPRSAALQPCLSRAGKSAGDCAAAGTEARGPPAQGHPPIKLAGGALATFPRPSCR